MKKMKIVLPPKLHATEKNESTRSRYKSETYFQLRLIQ
jgi:hypothetical protein